MARSILVKILFEVLFCLFLPHCCYFFLQLIPPFKVVNQYNEKYISESLSAELIIGFIVLGMTTTFVLRTHSTPDDVKRRLSYFGSLGCFVIWFIVIGCLMTRHANLTIAATTLNGALVCLIGIFFDKDTSGIISIGISSSALTTGLSLFPNFVLAEFILGSVVFVVSIVYQITSLDTNSRIKKAFFSTVKAIKSRYRQVRRYLRNEDKKEDEETADIMMTDEGRPILSPRRRVSSSPVF